MFINHIAHVVSTCRELLASFGDYFHVMFGSLSFCESHQNEVVLQDIDHQTLQYVSYCKLCIMIKLNL